MERAIVLEPLEPALVRELAELDLDIGRLDEGRAGYERSLALARTPGQRTAAFGGLTHYHHRRGEMADAIRAIEERLQEEAGFRTRFDSAYGRIADIFVYLDAGRVDEAVALLEELPAAFRASPTIYLSRSAVHVALATEGVDAALEAFRQASDVVEVKRSEGLRSTLLGDLGLIRDRAEDHAGAAESFRLAKALSPEGDSTAERNERCGGRGCWNQAEAELREALRLVPADPHAHVEMGLLMEARGNTGAAVHHLRSALAVWDKADEGFEPAREARAKAGGVGGVSCQ